MVNFLQVPADSASPPVYIEPVKADYLDFYDRPGTTFDYIEMHQTPSNDAGVLLPGEMPGQSDDGWFRDLYQHQYQAPDGNSNPGGVSDALIDVWTEFRYGTPSPDPSIQLAQAQFIVDTTSTGQQSVTQEDFRLQLPVEFPELGTDNEVTVPVGFPDFGLGRFEFVVDGELEEIGPQHGEEAL